jgi:hypothetical protein
MHGGNIELWKGDNLFLNNVEADSEDCNLSK